MSDIPDSSDIPVELHVVTAHILSEIVSYLDAQKCIDDTVIAELRNDYPNLRFTLCYETEMGSREPYAEHDKYDLHLVAHSAVGCSSLTFDLDNCTGFAIAVHDD